MTHTVTGTGDNWAPVEGYAFDIREACSDARSIRAYFLARAAEIIDDDYATGPERLSKIRFLLKAAQIVATELGVKL